MRVGARPAVRRVSTIILFCLSKFAWSVRCARRQLRAARERVFARYLESSLTPEAQILVFGGPNTGLGDRPPDRHPPPWAWPSSLRTLKATFNFTPPYDRKLVLITHVLCYPSHRKTAALTPTRHQHACGQECPPACCGVETNKQRLWGNTRQCTEERPLKSRHAGAGVCGIRADEVVCTEDVWPAWGW